MKPRWGRGSDVTGSLALGGLGLLAFGVAAALLWSEGRALAWTALGIGAVFGARIGREVAVQRRKGPPPAGRVGVAPLALAVGLGFLLVALLA